MLALTCPQCGSPCRVQLAREAQLSCSRCHHRAPLPADTLSRIHAALSALEQIDERKRQFHGMRGAVARSVVFTVIAYVLITVGVASLSAVITHALQPRGLGRVAGTSAAVLPGMACGLTLLVSLPGLLSLVRTGRKLRATARALPPLSPGEPSACRLCGGPVDATEGVVRCPFCATDNVVDRDVRARAGESHREQAYDLEEEVGAQASAIGETRGLGVPLITTLALLPLPIAVVWIGESLLAQLDLAAPSEPTLFLDEEGPFVWHPETRHQLCLHAVSRCQGSRSCVAHPAVPPSWAVGKTTTNGVKITAVATNPMRGTFARLERGHDVELDGVCIEGAETDAWKAFVAEHLRREREERAAQAASKERWRSVLGDAGVPELRPIPMPTLRIQPPQ